MLLILTYSLAEGLNVFDESARLSLSLILSDTAALFDLLDIFEHLFLFQIELVFELLKLTVDDIKLFFIFHICLTEPVGKLLRFRDKKFAVVFGVLVRIDKLLLYLKLKLVSLDFCELNLVLESLLILSRLVFVCEVIGC